MPKGAHPLPHADLAHAPDCARGAYATLWTGDMRAGGNIVPVKGVVNAYPEA